MKKLFSRLSSKERRQELGLEEKAWEKESLEKMSEAFIEQSIGYYPVPLGVVRNAVVNGKRYSLPLATEEASVIAGLQNMFDRIGRHGGVQSSYTGSLMETGVFFAYAREEDQKRVLEEKEQMEVFLKPFLKNIEAYGGGLKQIESFFFASLKILKVRVIVDVADAFGANLLNLLAQKTGEYFSQKFQWNFLMGVLSNHAPLRLVRSELKIPVSALGKWGKSITFLDHPESNQIKAHQEKERTEASSCATSSAFKVIQEKKEIAWRIVLLSQLAFLDPSRALTHNKGILNGVSALGLALGNDIRSIEAAAHGYAARNGPYSPLSSFFLLEEKEEYFLHGSLEMPCVLTPIGSNRKHPIAAQMLKMLGVRSARELSEVAGAVGLVQNLSALRSLVSEGIYEAHQQFFQKRLHFSLERRSVDSAQNFFTQAQASQAQPQKNSDEKKKENLL